jgi:hypothetical protein
MKSDVLARMADSLLMESKTSSGGLLDVQTLAQLEIAYQLAVMNEREEKLQPGLRKPGEK